ncbi:cytochrome P450 [Auriculariales sp. MPI-PUGE-AT-0066]|nr:cytochrome P450 [Auriculariales sp. MPI-PUGE-AT-0066]
MTWQALASSVLFRRLVELGGAFVSVWLLRLALRFHKYRSFRHIPGPPVGHLVWGHEWQMYNSPPGSLYADWAQKYGRLVQFDGCFGHAMLSVTDPRAIQEILVDDVYAWPKPEGARQWFLQLLGAGLLYVEGEEEHQRQRHAIAPALSAQHIRSLTPSFFRMATIVADKWDAQIQAAPGDSADIDVQFWANRLSLDNIGSIGFSIDFGSLENEKLHPVAEALDHLTNSSTSFAAFAMKALVWQFPQILRMPSEKGNYIRSNKKALGDIASNVWNSASAANEDEQDGSTLLSRLIQENHNKDPRERLEESEIRDQIATLISAGYETVSCIMAWVLYELACNQDAQSKLREELPPADPAFEKVHGELKYLDAVFMETVRLHPPILELHHVAGKSQVLPLSAPLPGTSVHEVPVPKGTIVAIPVNVVHQDPSIFGPDAHLFRPERWLEQRENGGGRKLSEKDILSFSRGPRHCLGRIFADVEIKAFVVTLVRQFKFSPIPGKEIEDFQSFVIRPRVKGEKDSTLPLRVSLVQS